MPQCANPGNELKTFKCTFPMAHRVPMHKYE